MSVEDNVQAARAAEEDAALLRTGEHARRRRYWERLTELALAEIGERPVAARDGGPMGVTEAQDWARVARYRRGMHAGRTVHEVSMSYADWWNEHTGDEFDRGLARYCASREASSRRDSEEREER